MQNDYLHSSRTLTFLGHCKKLKLLGLIIITYNNGAKNEDKEGRFEFGLFSFGK
jgi:hypothetical protein